jgi:endonuclease/exonuclease/phosphatase family metal-dependent hydrolase
MSASLLEEFMAAVEGLRGDVQAMRAEVDALKADVAALQARQDADARRRDAEVDAETLVMLAAAVTSYLGKRVRIRSAREVKTGREGAPAWARHGRAAIQTSHRLNRGH